MSVYLWCARVVVVVAVVAVVVVVVVVVAVVALVVAAVVVVAVAVGAGVAAHWVRGTWGNMVGTWHAINDGLRGVQTNWEARLGGS